MRGFFYLYNSDFLSFDEGARLELMQMPGIPNNKNDIITQNIGLLHFAVSLGSEESVSELTSRLKADGYRVISEPRRTGDGYFESCIFDPDNNRIEITV